MFFCRKRFIAIKVIRVFLLFSVSLFYIVKRVSCAPRPAMTNNMVEELITIILQSMFFSLVRACTVLLLAASLGKVL